MTLSDIIAEMNIRVEQLSAQLGAAGEELVINSIDELIRRPKGQKLQNIIDELALTGVDIKGSSFDAIYSSEPVDLDDTESIKDRLNDIIFVEIKTTRKKNIGPNFEGFFFALTENEISAAEQLGERHRVLLYNMNNGASQLTSVPEIWKRSSSINWQVSVQLTKPPPS